LDITWKNFCIIGLGNHAKNKIIPALNVSNKSISGIITSKRKDQTLNYRHFKTIEDALVNLSEDTVFFLSTPPEVHNIQARKILNYGRDVIIEKPGFIKAKDIKQITLLKNFKHNIVFEAFMYKYSLLYEKFVLFWTINNQNIISLSSDFYIPAIPKNTFRDKNDITSSCLYDLGCYGLSLLNDIGLCIDNINVKNVTRLDGKIIKIKLGGIINGINVCTNFGISKEYKNNITIIKKNNDIIKFWPFFKGIKETKYIEYIKKNNKQITEIDDIDAFVKMFNNKRLKLMSNQDLRFENMLVVTKKLNEIEKQIKIS